VKDTENGYFSELERVIKL